MNHTPITSPTPRFPFTPSQRSAIMRAVKSQNTAPELLVRRLLHSLGFRFRLHAKNLPGTPDLLFPARRQIILVHGCFWHGHPCPRGRRTPKNHRPYWRAKIARNHARDQRTLRALRRRGYRVLVLWECHTQNTPALTARLLRFLSPPQPRPAARPISHPPRSPRPPR